MGEEKDVAPVPTTVVEPEGIEGATEVKAVNNGELTAEEEKPLGTIDHDGSPILSAEAFVEESYYVKDLKDFEKKALQELKANIEEAIKSNTFLAPTKLVEDVSREAEMEKEGEEKKEEETEKKKVEGGMEAVSDEPVAAQGSKDVPVITKEAGVEAATDALLSSSSSGTEESSTQATVTENAAEVTSRDIAIDEEDSPSLEDLALWGVPLLHSKGDERTDVILLKFLRARDFRLNDAMEMLKETVMWRKEFEADSLAEEEMTSEYDSVAYMYGVDKEGHPVCYNNYGVFQGEELYQKTFGDEAQIKKFLRWRIQVLEKGIRKLDFSPNGVHSMVQITDLKDSPGFVKRRNITKKALTLLQDNYPELVAKQIFINVPWYFGALYSLHGKIVSQRSKSKVVVARSDKVTETLFKYIAPENVPLHYGGLSRPKDAEFQNAVALVKEVTVKAGEKQTIEFVVEEVGSTVVWDMAVVGWDVVYGEEFVPSVENAYTVIIQKPKKVAATEEPTRNSFKATQPGKVVLTVDNSSRRKRRAVYRYLIKRENSTEC